MALLELTAYGEGIGDAAAVLRNNAARAGLDAPVPTCPGWDVRRLIAHQGLVHRWAAAIVAGGRPRAEAQVEAEAAASDDLLGWLDDGLVELLNALGRAPDDLDVPFFLAGAPAPRLAWTRRQCHETSIHAVDAMAAALARPPLAAELWLRPSLADDGIDELLTGFLPRESTRLRHGREVRIEVRTADTGRAWTVTVGSDAPRTVRGETGDADLRLTGTARGLYLALWNRGDECDADGDQDLWRAWRRTMRVTWS